MQRKERGGCIIAEKFVAPRQRHSRQRAVDSGARVRMRASIGAVHGCS
jgi:hypothetical protein